MGERAMETTTPASTQSARAQILLRERVISGELPPGTRLFEVAMAEDLHISRTPVREAMARLAEEGLLERVRGGGFVVSSFSVDDARDAIELRGVLEGTAARLAAERGVAPEQMAEMQATLASLDEAVGDRPDDVNLDAYTVLNERFHHQLWALPASAVISREAARAARLPFAAPSAFLSSPARERMFRRSLHPAQEQHRTLVEAIAAREGARAEAIAREHSRAARINLEYILGQGTADLQGVPALALIVGEG